MVLDGLKPTFNIGKIFRSCQALGAREVFLINVPYFDPSPAKGAFKQTRSQSFSNFAEAYEQLKERGYTVYAMEPRAEKVMGVTPLASKAAFVMGHEEFGLSFKMEDYPEIQPLRVAQYGQVESMNVSVVASLALFEFVRQHELPKLGSKSDLEGADSQFLTPPNS